MDAAVITQEPAIEKIEDSTENTVVNLDKGNEHLDGAVVKARSARRKKWICFWIVGEFIYTDSPNALKFEYLMPASAHHPYHWGRCWGWCWSDGPPKIDLIATSFDFTHSPTLSHGIPTFSFLSVIIGLRASSDSCAGPCSSRTALQTVRSTSWMAVPFLIISRLHFKKPRALLLILAYVRHVG